MSGAIAPPARQASRGLTWQKVVLGDWSRLVRDPLDVARIVFIAGTIAWGLAGRPVTVVAAASILLVVARIASLPRFYDFSLIVVMVLIAWGEVLGVYDSWRPYDNVVHFTVPLPMTGMVYLLLVRLGVLPELSDLFLRPRVVLVPIAMTVLWLICLVAIACIGMQGARNAITVGVTRECSRLEPRSRRALVGGCGGSGTGRFLGRE